MNGSPSCFSPLHHGDAGGRARHESGQAAVESVLTLPLMVFLVLGTLQLFMMMHGRILAHYAAFKAARAGSVAHGDCERMTHAAILALMPSFTSFLGDRTPGSAPASKLAQAFDSRKANKYDSGLDEGHNEAIVWIIREAPLKSDIDGLSHPAEDIDFDQPEPAGKQAMRLEVRVVYWFPLRIPFADWVMTRMVLAQYGLLAYTAQNPLMIRQQANWTPTDSLPGYLQGELMSRVGRKHYVFPILASYGMRMMTPAKKMAFQTQNCPPAPETL